MTHTTTVRRVFGEIGGFLEHLVVVVLGFVLMVVGLGLGVTMIMLPVDAVLGLTGAGLFVAGIFGHLDSQLLDRVPDLIAIKAEQIRSMGLVPPAALQRLMNERSHSSRSVPFAGNPTAPAA